MWYSVNNALQFNNINIMNTTIKKTFLLFSLIFIVACSKEGNFTLESFDSTVRQNSASAKGQPNTEIVTTINGESYTLNLDEDFFYDLDEDEFVHLVQSYRVEFEVEETFVTVNVFFDIMTDRDNNRIVTSLPGGENGAIPIENRMTVIINGEETVVNVDNATVNYPRVSFDNGTYSFDISL